MSSGTVLAGRDGCTAMEPGPPSASRRLDVGGPDHLTPLLGFVGNELAKFRWRARKDRATHVGKPRLDLRIGKASINFLIEPVHNLCRRVLGHSDALPCGRLVAWNKL